MTTARTASARAAGVSRVLAQADMRPLPSGTSRSREGIRVTHSILGDVTVLVDLDSPAETRYLADAAFSELESRGYTVTRLGEAQARVRRPTWI